MDHQKNQDFLGVASFNLGVFATNPDAWTQDTQFLMGDKAKGSLTISARPYRDSKIKIAGATKLRNADGFFGKSDPYAKLVGLQGASMVWGATKTIQNNLNPTWNEEFEVDLLAKMPMGGKLAPLIVECWDEDSPARGSSDDRLGSTPVRPPSPKHCVLFVFVFFFIIFILLLLCLLSLHALVPI